MRSLFLLTGFISFHAAAMVPVGHYVGQCDSVLAVQYAKGSDMPGPRLQRSKSYFTVDMTATMQGPVQIQEWKTKIFAKNGPNGSPFNYQTRVESTGKNSERYTITYEPDQNGKSNVITEEYHIELDGSESQVSSTGWGKTKKTNGLVNDYVTDDGTYMRVESTNGYKAAGGTRVLSTKSWCVLKPNGN